MKLIWDVTKKCNLRCKHCGAASLLSNNIEKEDNWKNVIDYCKDSIDSVELLGGEPLLHKDIDKIIEYLSLNNIKVSIISNGQVDLWLLKKIMEYNENSIYISLEGLERTNDKIRGKGTWEKAIETIHVLKELNNNKINKTEIGLNIAINFLNYNEILSLIEFTKELNLVYQINPIVITGNAAINKDFLYIKEELLLDVYENISKYIYENPNIKINLLNEYPVINDYLNRKFGTNYLVEGKECNALVGSIYCSPEGEITPCRTFKTNKMNVNNSTFNKNFINFKELAELIEKDNKNEVCSNCKYTDICNFCPLEKEHTQPKICLIAIERLKSVKINPLTKFKLKDPYIIVNSEQNKCIYYPNLGSKTYYSPEGINILNEIIEACSIAEISQKTAFPENVIYEFLMQEKNSGKVIEIRG
ncbi:MAG: radical SAM protein [Clostridiaceae bacterium]